MVHNPRRFALTIVLILVTFAAGSARAQEAPESPEVGVCLPGAGYTSGCDVDQDGDIDIFDVQLTAGRWNSSGVYTSGHTHWGETWTGAVGATGLRLEHTAASGFTYGVYGQSASSDGIGLAGRTTAASGGMGMYGRSDGVGGNGVYGAAVTASGINYGVHGYSNSSGGYAGFFEGAGADALYVQNYATGRAIQATASNDTAIWGKSDSGLAGVDGWNAGPSGRGVSGYASAASGVTYGVYGEAASNTGTGVYGLASANSGLTTGVYGVSNSTGGFGVLGSVSATSGANFGVYGSTASSAGYAGYFAGRVHVNGTMSKAAGSFKIDHPLDPANQYLSHSFVESPDMMNVYNGNATLDEKGEVWVELPAWFEALNRDFRYQLTPIGGPGPDLYIAQEVQNNRFQIAGGSVGLRVSWQVTGIRQDAYANAHRIPVEEDKPADEQGLYLHPTELGKPAELGLDYQRNAMRADWSDSP